MKSIGVILDDATEKMSWTEEVQIIHLLGFIEHLHRDDWRIRSQFEKYIKNVVAEEIEGIEWAKGESK